MSYQTIAAKAYSIENGGREVVLEQERKRGDPDQMDLFVDEKTAWINETFEIALLMPNDFYFSELKAKCGLRPVSSTWWGTLASKMENAGFVKNRLKFKRTAMGNEDYAWSKPL
jgi:hypothetical protein